MIKWRIKKMFRFKKIRKSTPVIIDNTKRPYCKITVYNKAIKAHIAEYAINESEKLLVGAIKASYPSNEYRVEVVYY
jgi:hypothetical protein